MGSARWLFFAVALGSAVALAQPSGDVPLYADWHLWLGAVQFAIFAAWVQRLRADLQHRKRAAQRDAARGRTLELLADGAPLKQVLESIVGGFEQEHAAGLCSVLLLDKEGKHLGQCVAPHLPADYNAAIEGVAIGPAVGSCGTAAFTGQRVVVEDITTSPLWVPYRDLAARAGLAACWSQPILSGAGKVLGTFAVYHRTRHAPGAHELALLEQAAHLASIGIEKSAAMEKVRESEAHFRLLTEDVADVVWKTDARLVVTYISPADERQRGFRASEVVGRSVLELFTEEGVTVVKAQLKQRARDEANGQPTGFFAFEAPHRCKDGSVIWGEVMSKPERDATGAIVGYHGITREITERRLMQEQVRQLAFLDPLTQLPNRRLLSDRLGQALLASKRDGVHCALMFLDLDHFKALNDAHGHEAGDVLLVEAASRLKGCVRAVDTVCRLGGDEFIVLLSNLGVARDAATTGAAVVAEKLRASLAAPWRVCVRAGAPDERVIDHQCTASIGVVVFASADGTPEDFLKWADAAMYVAKGAGRNQVHFHHAAS